MSTYIDAAGVKRCTETKRTRLPACVTQLQLNGTFYSIASPGVRFRRFESNGKVREITVWPGPDR